LKPENLSILLIAIGIILVGLGVSLAIIQFYTYTPIISQSNIDEAMTSILAELLSLVARLGFIGLIIYAGGLTLKNGVHTLLELRRIEKGVSIRMESSKQG